jgi:hypothetical protein
MLNLLLTLFFAGPFDIGFVYFEMSMDTYQYGSDPSPLVKTFGNKHPKIDSLVDSKLYGHLGRRPIVWDSLGRCVSSNCKKKEDLTWSDYWLDPP